MSFSMQMSIGTEMFIPLFCSYESFTKLAVCIVKEWHLQINQISFNFLFVVYKIFLPMLLVCVLIAHSF